MTTASARSRPAWRVAVGALALLALLAAGCSDDDGDSDGDEAAATESDDAPAPADDGESDGDEAAAPSGETDLGNFPIPAPPGGDGNVVQEGVAAVVSYPASEFDNVVAFYEEWIEQGDWASPDGLESNVVVLDTGQMSATAFASETEIYMIIGTLDGDRLDVALSVQNLG